MSFLGWFSFVLTAIGIGVSGLTAYMTQNESANVKEYSITTEVNGLGSISPQSLKVKKGEKTALTITPNKDFYIAGVTGCDGKLIENQYNVNNISQDCLIKAEFKEKVFHITTYVEGAGQILPSSAEITKSELPIEFDIQPDELYQIEQVTGCDGTLINQTYSVNQLNDDCQIDVVFTKIHPDKKSIKNLTVSEVDLDIYTNKVHQLHGALSNVENIERPKILKLDGIYFNANQYNDWEIINKSPYKAKKLLVRYGDSHQFALLELDDTLPEFSRAIISFPTENITNLKYTNLMYAFNPQFNIGGNETVNHCKDKPKGKVCYGAPLGKEKDVYEISTTTLHHAFNGLTFQNDINDFFIKNCEYYKPCKNYKEKLTYGYKNLLHMGFSNYRKITMDVMRNKYVAEGVGGGNWIAIWEKYLARQDPYHKHHYNIFVHELGHAYGYSHASGMTYGFADYIGGILASWPYPFRGQRALIMTPKVVVQYKVIDPKTIEFNLNSLEGGNKNISMYLLSHDSLTYDVIYYPSEKSENNKITIKFSKDINSTIYFRFKELSEEGVIDHHKDLLSTYSFSEYDVTPQQKYRVDNKIFTLLDKKFFSSSDNGWKIRSRCHHTFEQALATKAEYEKLWQYLYDNDLMSTLGDTNHFLSRDEPSGYRIWKVHFTQNKMSARKVSMHSSIGNSTGLICVVPDK